MATTTAPRELLKILADIKAGVSVSKEEASAACEGTFSILMDTMNRKKAQRQVTNHIKAISGAGNPAIYHNNRSVSDLDKVAVYRLCFNAANSGDFTMLDGQGEGLGDKRADPIEDIPVFKEKAATPATTQKPPQQPDAAPSVTPRAEVVKAGEAEELVRILRRLGAGGSPVEAKVDDKQVESIVDERIAVFEKALNDAFHDKVKKVVSNGGFPTDKVKALFEELCSNMVRRVEFVTSTGELRPVDGLMHPQVPEIVAWLRAGVPVWIWSAAGSGKTHMARQIAAMLEVDPHVISVDPTLTVAKLMGYRNVANGNFVEGYVFKPFKEGGLCAFDEVDTGDPGVVASSNALLSNGHYLFPNNETVTKHEKFHVLAMANTKGMGAVAGYTARNRLDAATLDRFAIIEIKYDAGLESALACGIGEPGEPWKPGVAASQDRQQAYVKWVQSVRAQFGSSILISPRASINGCKALRAGIPMVEVANALVFKLCTEDTINRIKSSCPLPV